MSQHPTASTSCSIPPPHPSIPAQPHGAHHPSSGQHIPAGTSCPFPSSLPCRAQSATDSSIDIINLGISQGCSIVLSPIGCCGRWNHHQHLLCDRCAQGRGTDWGVHGQHRGWLQAHVPDPEHPQLRCGTKTVPVRGNWGMFNNGAHWERQEGGGRGWCAIC